MGARSFFHPLAMMAMYKTQISSILTVLRRAITTCTHAADLGQARIVSLGTVPQTIMTLGTEDRVGRHKSNGARVT